MKGFLISRCFALVIAQSALPVFLCGPLAAQSQTNDAAGEQAQFRIKAESNLVIVRVVVRDSQGRPVENLRKEDFRLFDRGRAQSIVQFAVANAGTAPSSQPEAHRASQPAPSSPPAVSRRFLGFYFDDLNASEAELMQVREAADRYLAANLQPNDFLAIFTPAGMLCDFTADPQRILTALSRLHSSRVSVRQCPDISDYQAQEITETGGDTADNAFSLAVDDAVHRCQISSMQASQFVRGMVASIVAQAQIRAQTSLQGCRRHVIMSP